MAHNEAPWQVEKSFRDTYVVSGKRSVALVLIADDLDTEANAALIAASPDLLEACEKAFTQLCLIQTVGSQRAIKKGEVDSSLSLCALRDAINKAKGKAGD